MIVGVCRLEVDIPAAGSLKDKRAVLQSYASRVRRRFAVSVAEIELQDQWDRAVLGIAVVSNNGGHARGVLEKIVRYLDTARVDAEIIDVSFEIVDAL